MAREQKITIPGKKTLWGRRETVVSLFICLTIECLFFLLYGQTRLIISIAAAFLITVFFSLHMTSRHKRNALRYQKHVLAELEKSDKMSRQKVLQAIQDNGFRRFLSLEGILSRTKEDNQALLDWAMGGDGDDANRMGKAWIATLIPPILNTRGIGRDREATQIRILHKRYEGHSERLKRENPLEALSMAQALNALVRMKRLKDLPSPEIEDIISSIRSVLDGMDEENKTGIWKEREAIKLSLSE